jgi:transglutaminase-like putative cysteine protease
MTQGREKRLLLGWMALLAPLPLPFNEPRPLGVVGFPFLVVYLAAVLLFLQQSRAGRQRWLGNGALNVLGAVYTPFLVFDVALHGGGGLVTPMMHLALFALAAKLFSLRRERDKWHVVVGLFFVFVTAMATSASAGIVGYMVVFVALWAALLARFARFHVQGHLESAAEQAGPPRSMRRLIGVIAVAALLLAIPLFFLFPRLRNPLIFGPGRGSGLEASTGFSDTVTLDGIGRIRTSSEVAMRVAFEGERPEELRFRGAAFELYGQNRWQRVEQQMPLTNEFGRYVVAEGRPTASARIWLEPIGASSLIVPQGTLYVAFAGARPPLLRFRTDTLVLRAPPAATLQYRTELGERAQSEWPFGFGPELDRSGITPAIGELALRVAGDGDAALRARTIERHLMSEYGYTLDFVGREGTDPLGEFLFRYRSGHCELFASAMVLMLRSIDIPARLVTGFLGAEESALGYDIVRQSNAHAWVEAYLPGSGWTVFDPTPPAGRPGLSPTDLWSLLRQAYDFAIFGWDRYVISYGLNDQRLVFERARAWLDELLRRLRPDRREPGPPMTLATEGEPLAVDMGSEQADGRPRAFAILGVLFLLGALAVAVRWYQIGMDGVRAYRQFRRHVEARGVTVELGTPPLQVARRVVLRFPAAAAPARRIVELYLLESYGGVSLSAEQRFELRQHIANVNRVLRRAG